MKKLTVILEDDLYRAVKVVELLLERESESGR